MGVGTGLYMYDVVVKKFMFTVSSPDEFLLAFCAQNAIFPFSVSIFRVSCRELCKNG